MASPRNELDGVLVVDKARGPTSHDVVAVARRVLGTRAIGHTGTLDPMATGVLVLVVGEATKLVDQLTAQSKAYEATLVLGRTTHTLDADGEVTQTLPVPALSLDEVRAAAAGFLGETDQRVPAVSAVKVQGQALYKRARTGAEIEAPIRRVVLEELAISALRADEIDLRLRCGKGFYVRALARDLAQALGTCGHLSRLRRVQNGMFGLDHALDFELLRAAARGSDAERAAVRERLVPVAPLCAALPHVVLASDAVTHARHGRAFSLALLSAQVDLPEDAVRVALSEQGEPVALVRRSGDLLRVVRGFRQL